ncbi:MAG: hypothetical protein KatS3mg056_0353 [Chloroflexus sp.]|nr:MAG: hypothetical protein KatS3mg056_0353 [Chloroflexus sp.]
MSVYRAAQALHRQGIARIVITLGAAGAIGIDADGAVRATPPAIPVHNPIGCGDSFFAGLTVALSRGHSLADAVRLATACGATDAQTLEPGRIDPATVATLRCPGTPRRVLDRSHMGRGGSDQTGQLPHLIGI